MLGGLAYDPTDGTMYGSGTNDDIYTIDVTTGVATFVGVTGLGGNIPDIHFDQAGNLYGSKRGAGGIYDFISIDKTTGAGTVIGSTGFAAVAGLATRLTPPARPAQVSLIFPPNDAVISSDSVMLFLWNRSFPHVDSYWFELSADSMFSQSEIDSAIIDTLTFVYDLANNQNYWWRVRAHNNVGWGQFSETRNFRIVVTGTEDSNPISQIPHRFALEQNYPNPFNPTTTIGYSLGEKAHVRLEVFNQLGQSLAVLANAEQQAGYHEVIFDGEGLASGLYFYRLRASLLELHSPRGQAGAFVATKKLIVLR